MWGAISILFDFTIVHLHSRETFFSSTGWWYWVIIFPRKHQSQRQEKNSELLAISEERAAQDPSSWISQVNIWREHLWTKFLPSFAVQTRTLFLKTAWHRQFFAFLWADHDILLILFHQIHATCNLQLLTYEMLKSAGHGVRGSPFDWPVLNNPGVPSDILRGRSCKAERKDVSHVSPANCSKRKSKWTQHRWKLTPSDTMYL